MGSIGRTLLLSLALSGAGSALASDADTDAGADRLHMVLIFATEDVGIWQRRFSGALMSHPDLETHDPPVSVATEYLGIYGADEADEAQLAETLRYKQGQRRADVVVSVQVADAFLARWGDEIYPGVPRLYVLPGPDVAEREAGRPDARVLASGIRDAIARTVADVPEVMPGVRRVLVITGANALDANYLDHARVALEDVSEYPEVEYLHDLPLDVLEDRLARAAPDEAALLLTYEGGPDGQTFRTVDVLPRLLAASGAPIFVAYDSLFGGGAVGGVMTSTEDYGRTAAELALALARGESTPDRPGTALRRAYDVDAMRAEGLDPSRVPEGAEAVNAPIPVWQEYAREFSIGVIVMIAQLLLILALWRLWRLHARDGEELRRRADDLSRQKRLFESVVNSIPAAIVVTGEDGSIERTNAGFRQVFAAGPEAVVGRPCTVLVPEGEASPLDRAGVERGIAGLLQRSDGHCFPGEWSATAILTDDGARLGHVLVLQDVSERVAREDERRQAQKMEALGGLAGGIAHDFNNLLTVMLGHAELIAQGHDADRDAADRILEAGGRARDLVGRILAFSRKEVGGTHDPLDLHDLVDEAERFLRASLPPRVVLEVVAPEPGTAVVVGDESQLHQVLINLATNARDAMGSAGGTLRLCVHAPREEARRTTSHGIVEAGMCVRIEVSDTGPGMDAALLQRAFDPFFTTKAPGSGTGMGLSLVYGIIQAHGGAIDVDSAPGTGTRFDLYLPASDRTVARAPKEAPAASGLSERILLVDDEPAVRALARRQLERLGCTVEDFEAPEAALEAWRRDPDGFSAVLTDRSMPGMDGVELCRALREAGARIPVILASGYNEPLDDATHARLAPVLLLAKPWRTADLAARLERALDAGRPTRLPAAATP